MSIPPISKPSDYDKFLSRYLADLNLQVKLNQENYDANVAFFKTGVQATERADTRSLEARKMDVETLKIQARTMLNKLTNSLSADEVLTFLVNSNLLFFFVQNFVDFERTINKRYPSQTASAPILRVLIQKSFDKQNEEIPLLKDELIVATNNVASREIMQKALTDIYNKRDTNPVIYEILRNPDFLDIFPTLEEKLNIVKFPERKFKSENDINYWNYLPTNKTIQELLDLYEQLYNGVSPNIQSTQNQINNIENNIESQLSNYVNIDIKPQIEAARKARQLANQTREGRRQREEQDILAAEQERKVEQYRQAKSGKQATLSSLKNIGQETKERSKLTFREQYEQNLMSDYDRFTPREQQEQKLMSSSDVNAPQRKKKNPVKLSETKSVLGVRVRPKIVLDEKPEPKQPEPIQAEPIILKEEEFMLTPRKVKSVKVKEEAKEEPKYKPTYKMDISDESLKIYTDRMNFTKPVLKAIAKNNYNIVYDEMKRQYGDKKIATLKRVIAIQQYLQDNKYTLSPVELEAVTRGLSEVELEPGLSELTRGVSKIQLKPLNELTRGSYAEKLIIPDPNVPVLESSAEIEGKGLLTKRQQDIHRFKVLKGQILAGNNNKKIVIELKALVLKLNKLGQISNKQATQVLQELNTILK